MLVFVIDYRNCNEAGFWSDRRNPDKVLMASYTVRRSDSLPPNKIINKGYNSEYWDCSELQKAMGTHNNEILDRCGKFVNNK
jgi:hypothetical protein